MTCKYLCVKNMGAGESTDTRYLERIKMLQEKDYSQDEKFLTELISLSPPRNSALPSPRELYTVTANFPHNTVALYKTCIKYLAINENASSEVPIPDIFSNQLSFVLNLINMISVVLIQTSTFHPLLYQFFGIENTESENTNHQEKEENQQVTHNEPELSLFRIFLETSYKLLFSKNITVFNQEELWYLGPEEEKTVLLRRDIVHSILFNLNLQYFRKIINQPAINLPINYPQFPSDLFIISISNMILYYLHNSAQPSQSLLDLLQNSVSLASTLTIVDKSFTQEISQIEPQIFNITLDLFFQTISTNPFLPFADEIMLFIYLLLHHNEFMAQELAEGGETNFIIFTILQLIQSSFEKYGASKTHKLDIAILYVLVSNSLTAASLNVPQSLSLATTFRPHRGTYADLLFEILLNIFDSLPNSVCKLFSCIAGHVDNLSLYNAVRLANSVEKLINSAIAQNKVAEVRQTIDYALICFAKIVQKQEIKNYNIMLVVYQKIKTFKALKATLDEEDYWVSLEIVIKFCEEAKQHLLKSGKKQVTAEEAAKCLETMNIEDIFPVAKEFEKEPSKFEDEIWESLAEKQFERVTEQERELLKFNS